MAAANPETAFRGEGPLDFIPCCHCPEPLLDLRDALGAHAVRLSQRIHNDKRRGLLHHLLRLPGVQKGDGEHGGQSLQQRQARQERPEALHCLVAGERRVQSSDRIQLVPNTVGNGGSHRHCALR